MGLLAGFSRCRSEISVRLHHAFVDAAESAENAILFLGELLCVAVSGSLLIHLLAKRLDRALEDGLLCHQVFIFDGGVTITLNLHLLALVERGWEAARGRTRSKAIDL